MSPSNIHPETAELLEESGLPNLTLIYLISAGCVLLVVGGRGYPILSYSNPVICTYNTYTCLPHAHLSLLYHVVSLYGIPSWTSAHVSLLHSCEGLDSGRELASWWGQSTAAESIILLISIDSLSFEPDWICETESVCSVHMSLYDVCFGWLRIFPFRSISEFRNGIWEKLMNTWWNPRPGSCCGGDVTGMVFFGTVWQINRDVDTVLDHCTCMYMYVHVYCVRVRLCTYYNDL